jgi:hypothetical protein
MRLWTLHPSHLDPVGLVALWRESLLAQAVLRGKTRGYKSHPQLTRFRAQDDPVAAIAAYLRAIHAEATARGYSFDRSRIVRARPFTLRIPETRGQLLHEWSHLGQKLAGRNPGWFEQHHRRETPTGHPIFRIVSGKVRPWERSPEAAVR